MADNANNNQILNSTLQKNSGSYNAPKPGGTSAPQNAAQVQAKYKSTPMIIKKGK